MTRFVPHQSSFDFAKKLDKFQAIALIISTVFAILHVVLSNISSKEIPNIKCYDDIANGFSTFFSIVFITLDIIVNYKFYKAEIERRKDLIDHAFDKNYTGGKSTGYFNAQGVPIGVYKLAVQSFENSLYTSEVAKRMTLRKWIVAIIITAIFVLSACIGDKFFVNTVLQLGATGVFILQAIKLQLFSSKMNDIHSDFKKLFTDLKDGSDKTLKEGEMILYVLNYETTLSWASILTDSKIFDELNIQILPTKWGEMKRDYRI
ncbi:MAG: hypothetical protein HY062_06755 [Bacteroidetes bacterium]|nr:hypothetical protein [Bacteroidota bacterium]